MSEKMLIQLGYESDAPWVDPQEIVAVENAGPVDTPVSVLMKNGHHIFAEGGFTVPEIIDRIRVGLQIGVNT